MTCVQSLCRSFIRPLNSSECSRRIVPWNDQNPSTSFYKAGRKRLVIMKSFLRQRNLGIEVPLLSAGRFDGCKNVKPKNGNKKGENIAGASSGANVETTNVDETERGKSGVYSCNMTQAMGAVLTYKHELGMNYNFVLPDLIVGSCLQNPADVDKLRDMGVGTIFCLQQDPDLEYFGVDITAIEARAKEYDGLQHIRAEIRDFDPFDLRMQLPIVVSKLHKVARNGHGIIYVHCTAGLGRAPAVVIAYMFWVRGYKLLEANKLLQSVRPCFPKLEAIKSATADMLIGDSKQRITLKLHKGGCTSVEISGLDIGWGQRIPLAYNEKHGCWVLQRELPEGYYEYKYIIDGNWTYNPDELVTSPNKDGHANNYIEVRGDHLDDTKRNLRWRLMQEDVDLTEGERQIIFERLEALADAKQPRI